MSYGGSVGASAIVTDAINTFYRELKFYNFNNTGFTMKTGHFTQIVWNASIEIGVGVATYPDQRYKHRTVVCINYRPPGNVQGQFQQNVLPLQKSIDFVLDAMNNTGTVGEHKPVKIMVL